MVITAAASVPGRADAGRHGVHGERITGLGGVWLADHRRPDGSGWITLADPEGNEFCVLSKDPARSGATT